MPAASQPDPRTGRSIVTSRALRDVVRRAVLGSYGVTGIGRTGWRSTLRQALGFNDGGMRVNLRDGGIGVDLALTIAYGVPIAEVARQVDSAVRYAVRQAVGLEVARLTIRVGGLRYRVLEGGRGDTPASMAPPGEPAGSGTEAREPGVRA